MTTQDHRTEDWRALGKRFGNWGRWGADDQLGTRNLITADRVKAASALVRRGAVFDLGIPFDEDGPQIGGGRTNPTRVMSVVGGAAADYGAQRYNDDYVFMPLQAATQWDALSHVYYDDLLFNGFPSSSVDRHGAHKLGIETQSKGIVGRGVLLDVAAHLEVDWLAADHVITPEQLDEVAGRQGVEVGAGDIVLIRTGWRRKFVREGDGRAFLAEEPGIGLECCAYLREHDVAAVASDNWAVEVVPSQLADETFPVHMVLIRDMGLLLGEMFDLEELGADCARDRVYEFFLSAPVLKFTHGVGSPVNPLAIK
ncbi:cyclase family protein [Amycolatopsis sp. NBC_01480]|uniref:cyclase family protein n=1 Tax=Amycolatopsis sp. NBC_01480 TaxID=2903562 RepID=UPI002E29643F|nr:cyclase family protein [Amycolatopsis sp. NBC_01480]